MNQVSKLAEWIKKTPNWAKTVTAFIGAILTLVSLFLLFRDNFYVLLFVVIPLLIITVILLSLYLIITKTEPLVEGGSGVFVFSSAIRKAAGILLIATFISSGTYYASENGKKTTRIAWFGTPTLTPTQTMTPTVSPTFTWTPSPQSESVTHYYMIVLDASINMQESFDGQSKWGAALVALSSMFEALNRHSNYGLVVVGGSSENSGTDDCSEPSTPIIPFVNDQQVFLSRDTLQMEDLITEINRLQPIGGGSLYAAFALAKQQLDDLPANTVKSMIFITGSNDTCKGRDEWRELERVLQLPNLVGLYSEIIILDEDAGLITQNIAERINGLSETVNVQVSENNQQLQQITGNVINQVNQHVEEQQATLGNNPTENVISISPPTSAPPVVVVVPPPTLTAIPPTQIPPTPKPPTAIPQPTNTLAPLVELLSVNYLQTGVGCQADITVRVSGSYATGSFHAWNANYEPAGDIYPATTLQVGTYSGYLITLGGLTPEYYRHEVWFEYNGTSSNRLTNLVCPGLTPAP